jgi:hypothetical protein
MHNDIPVYILYIIIRYAFNNQYQALWSCNNILNKQDNKYITLIYFIKSGKILNIYV